MPSQLHDLLAYQPSLHGMSTPPNASTPRRGALFRRHHRNNQDGGVARTMYADLLIQQLLAQATTDSSPDSSKSSSPPEAPDSPAVTTAPPALSRRDSYDHSNSVNLNRGDADTPTKDSAKSKDIPTYNGNLGQNVHVQSAPADMDISGHSAARSTTSSSSSSAPSVPDLDTELVSRMQYYSDFTIDRQRKIEQAAPIPSASNSEENSPPTPSEASSEHLSQRCVEGSESPREFVAPTLPPKISVARAISRDSSKDSRHSLRSGDMCESDTSSGTGSMPRSRSSSQRSRQSRQSRASTYSSGSSRASRLSSHPLASSTFISDPSNSGSVYLWSLDNSSDENCENLQKSFLKSSEKRQHRKSRSSRNNSRNTHKRPSSRSRKSSRPVSSSRPVTLIGADSPPDHTNTDGGQLGSSLHLTHMMSVIQDPVNTPRRFGGSSFENGAVVSPRSTSLPRTSTRICLTPGGTVSHKASSTPELSSSRYPDLNLCVTQIGPSNLSSDIQQRSSTPGSRVIITPGRPDLLGKSNSTSDDTYSFYSQCSECNPAKHFASPSSRQLADFEHFEETADLVDDILTNSPCSYSSSGVCAPYNSYTSPAGSANEYTTISDSSPERNTTILSSAPKRTHVVKSPGGGVFKVPCSPAVKTVKRKSGLSNSTQSVGVRAVGGTPHLPLALVKNNQPASRKKLFSSSSNSNSGQSVASPSSGVYHAPKVLDKKGLARRIKKFTINFKRGNKERAASSSTIQTLANL